MAKRQLQPDARPIPRCWLYSDAGGQIFEGEEAIEAARADGWQDEPVPLAQSDSADEDLVSRNRELNQTLATQYDELTAAKKALAEAEQKLQAEIQRADAAEKENKTLAAALKKAKASAGK